MTCREGKGDEHFMIVFLLIGLAAVNALPFIVSHAKEKRKLKECEKLFGYKPWKAALMASASSGLLKPVGERDGKQVYDEQEFNRFWRAYIDEMRKSENNRPDESFGQEDTGV